MFAAPLRLDAGSYDLVENFSPYITLVSWSQEKDPLLHGQSLVPSLLILISAWHLGQTTSHSAW
jgi:hypothetical protein